MKSIKALSNKYQKLVNKTYSKNREYHSAINHAHLNDLPDNTVRIEKLFNQSELLIEKLPKKERLNFQKQYKNIHNYSI